MKVPFILPFLSLALSRLAFVDGQNKTMVPTRQPTHYPTKFPTGFPSLAPTFVPSAVPSFAPSLSPSNAPSTAPTIAPSMMPSQAPWNSHELQLTITRIFSKNHIANINVVFANGCKGTISLFPKYVSAFTIAADCNSCSIGDSIAPSHAPTKFRSAKPTKKPLATKPTSKITETPTALPTGAPTKMRKTKFPTHASIPTHKPSHRQHTHSPSCPPTHLRNIEINAAELPPGTQFTVKLLNGKIATFMIQDGKIVADNDLRIRVKFNNRCTGVLKISAQRSSSLALHRNACMPCETLITARPHSTTKGPRRTRTPFSQAPTTAAPTAKPTKRPHTASPVTPRPTRFPVQPPPTPKPECGCEKGLMNPNVTNGTEIKPQQKRLRQG